MSKTPSSVKITRNVLDELYARYNHRQWVHPDPLEFLYDYEDLRDREIVALVASSLAYGRVAQILKSAAEVLEKMGPAPSFFLKENSREQLQRTFRDFKHRFTTGEELATLLFNMRQVIGQYGSLRACFLEGFRKSDTTILNALASFTEKLTRGTRRQASMFMPSPRGGSACKRLNLFLRWMVRSDNVDPGGWNDVPPSALIVPLDTHLHRISLLMGLTCRKQADMRTALEITHVFKSLVPEDPVRYDFVLTRFGIREDLDLQKLKKQIT